MAELISPGYRFSSVTPDDHAGFIYIAAFLSFIYSNLTFLTRCFIKRKVFGFDDWAICLAQIAFIVQFAFLLVSLSAGLGKNFKLLSGDEYSRMSSSQFGNQVAFFFSLGLSKVGTILLVQRLFTRDTKKFWIVCTIVTSLMIVWTITSALMVSVGCSPTGTAPVTEEQICPSIFTRYQFVIITDVLTDVLLVLAPAYLVCQLQMTTKLKVQVITVFAFRLPLLPLSIMSLKSFHKSLHSTNPGIDRTPAIAIQQSQLCFSLIAATLPCLKSFIRSFDTGSGVNVTFNSSGYGSGAFGRAEAFRMQSLGKDGSGSSSQNRDTGDIKASRRAFSREGHDRGRNFSTSTSTKITTQGYPSDRPRDEDNASHASQELFIRRDVQWEVHSEHVRPSGSDNNDIAEQRRSA